jgi:TatD DNase family protein
MSDLEKLFDSHTHNFDTKHRGIVQVTLSSRENLPFYFSFGVHPKESTVDLTEIEDVCNGFIQKSGFLAIGEIGLDNRYDSFDKQEEIYIFQLKLAAKFNKPVILHCVNSWDRCRFLHERNAPETTLIYHGFNKVSILESVLDYPNSIISIGESVLANQQLQSRLVHVPDARLLIETDTGKGELIDTYRLVAEIKKLSLQALIELLDQNAKRIFKYE